MTPYILRGTQRSASCHGYRIRFRAVAPQSVQYRKVSAMRAAFRIRLASETKIQLYHYNHSFSLQDHFNEGLACFSLLSYMKTSGSWFM
jgi:hypothetical protein